LRAEDRVNPGLHTLLLSSTAVFRGGFYGAALAAPFFWNRIPGAAWQDGRESIRDVLVGCAMVRLGQDRLPASGMFLIKIKDGETILPPGFCMRKCGCDCFFENAFQPYK
jgi:hypothetical protein